MGGSITKEIAAAPEAAQEVATGAEHATQIQANLMEHDVLLKEGANEIEVGAVIREAHVILGRKEEALLTITATRSKLPCSISANVCVAQAGAVSKDKAARMGSWTIVEGNDKSSSTMAWTCPAAPAGWWESLSNLLCGRCILRSILQHFEHDLDDTVKEAERQQALKGKDAVS